MRVWIIGAVIVAAAGAVIAQAPPRPRPVLHEPIPDLDPSSPPVAVGGAKHGSNPTAIVSGDKALAKPSLDRPSAPSSSSSSPSSATSSSAPVLGTKDFAADRATTMKPDENTGSDGTLHYVSVFHPDGLPFKRMSAFDQTDDAFTLHVARAALAEVPVGGTADPRTRDRFWGDVEIQLAPGVDVPLPSVAPDMRILSYEAKPAGRLAF